MDPYVAEVRMFGFNFPPKGWAFCNGQLLPISQNTALFSLVGTFYGGNGESNFALPNFQGNVPLHAGFSTTGTQFDLGETDGAETVTLLQSEMPSHQHPFNATTQAATSADLSGLVPAYPGWSDGQGGSGPEHIYSTTAPGASMSQGTTTAGGNQPHNNLMPYLTLNFCIALQGVYPPRG